MSEKFRNIMFKKERVLLKGGVSSFLKKLYYIPKKKNLRSNSYYHICLKNPFVFVQQH